MDWLVAPHGQALISKTTPLTWSSLLPKYLTAALSASSESSLILAHVLTAAGKAAPLEVCVYGR